MNNKGLTLLELLITFGIIAAIAAFLSPGIEYWKIKKDFVNSFNELEKRLIIARNEAINRSTTTRVNINKSNDTYTITTHIAANPITTCDLSASWSQISSFTLEMNTRFQMTGSGVGSNLCFYRDRTASGATYNIVQKDGLSDLGTSSITVTIATGYVDASISTGQ